MFQGLVMAVAGLGGELPGAPVQLRRQFGGFFRRTTERDERLGEFRDFHGRNSTTEGHR